MGGLRLFHEILRLTTFGNIFFFKSTIFTRIMSHTREANHHEIVRMANEDLEIRHKKEIDDLRKSYEEEISSLKDECDRLDQLSHDYSILQRENIRIIDEKNRWISLASQFCKELWKVLPEEEREEQIRNLLKRHGKEDYYKDWFKES